MKKYLKNLIILFFLMVYSCSSNLSSDAESNYYYKSAINYIKNDSTAIQFIANQAQANFNSKYSLLKIAVSPKIFPPQLAEFGSFAVQNKLNFNLNNKQFNYNNSITDSLIKFENYLFYEPYINNELISLSSDDSADAIIFFSKVYNNFLTAMLFYRDNTLTDTEVPEFRASLNFLIIFRDKKIDKVLTQMMSP